SSPASPGFFVAKSWQSPPGSVTAACVHRTDTDLSPRGAVDACVGDGAFPFRQVPVLLGETGEGVALEGVLLDVVDAALDLALVPGHVRLGRQENRAVVGGEGLHL